MVKEEVIRITGILSGSLKRNIVGELSNAVFYFYL